MRGTGSTVTPSVLDVREPLSLSSSSQRKFLRLMGFFSCNATPDTNTAVLADAFKYMGDQTDVLAAMHPFRGLGMVDDLTGPAVFLASDDARWITGVLLAVDGGFTAR